MATSCITIFGLAHDATDREVHVLFSGCPGYVQCKLVPNKDHTQRPFAFVQFETPDEAVHATTSRSGTVWDVGMYPIAIEISKRNMPGVAEGAGGQPPQAVRPPPARVPAQQGCCAAGIARPIRATLGLRPLRVAKRSTRAELGSNRVATSGGYWTRTCTEETAFRSCFSSA